MAKIKWDQTGERRFENGVDRGVLYMPDETGKYVDGVPWNGLVNVTEKPSGAEPTAVYADNIKYITLISAEEYAASIEAITYPDEFLPYDGLAEVAPGVFVGQQPRGGFGLSFRTLIGDDLNPQRGYKIGLIYGALAATSEKAHATINDSPEAATFTWELSTNPVELEGHKPTASLTIDSTKVDAAALAELESLLYGTETDKPQLPTPAEVIALFAGTGEAGGAGAQGMMAPASFSNAEDNSTDYTVQQGEPEDNEL